MKNGFTLIELLLVIGIIAILAGLAVPLGMNFYRSQAVESARSQLLETLGKARHNAVLMKGDSRYGVNILTIGDTLSSYTLYKCNSYSAPDPLNDEIYEQMANLFISASGTAAIQSGDINFSKLAGTTTATGTITIRHGAGSEARTIVIDDFGNAYKQ